MSSDRIQLLDFPQALPGHCVICGNSGGEGRTFIDFGFQMDFFGAVIFCNECFQACCNKFGYWSEEQVFPLKIQLEEMTGRYQRVEAENAKLRNALDSLNFLPSSQLSRIVLDPKPVESKGQVNKGPAKSANESGSKDVPDNDPFDVLDI